MRHTAGNNTPEATELTNMATNMVRKEGTHKKDMGGATTID